MKIIVQNLQYGRYAMSKNSPRLCKLWLLCSKQLTNQQTGLIQFTMSNTYVHTEDMSHVMQVIPNYPLLRYGWMKLESLSRK